MRGKEGWKFAGLPKTIIFASQTTDNYHIIMTINSLFHYFDLGPDKLKSKEAIDEIRRGVQFRGASLWILVCAVFIASLGLNMNSTAVIIGAMLISPLMGPIMGIGLGLAIHDTPLLQKSAKNLAVATLFALLTSCLYFWITPLSDARSELLARTQPTLYDVLIAFFGGFAGIIATGTKSKGNILPGVAIATALMPPLCTAGYGLATAQWQFLYGAFYLFLINAVYIGLATWLGCRMLHLPKNEGEMSRSRIVMTTLVVIAVMIPSAFTTIQLIHHSVREARISDFVHEQFGSMEDTKLVNYRYIDNDSVQVIEVALLGEPLDEHSIELIAAHMSGYSLPETCQLKVVQGPGGQEFEAAEFSGTIIQSMIHTYQELILKLQHENDSLQQVIRELTAPTDSITNNTEPK